MDLKIIGSSQICSQELENEYGLSLGLFCYTKETETQLI
jgi:hypothetical protein